jgi:signal transduction histidine kinase
MTGSRRSKRNAVLGFVLVSALVVGGMTWATTQTLRLAQLDLENQAREERAQRLALALSRMEDVVGPRLAVEYGRPFWDYFEVYAPEHPLSSDLQELDRGSILLLSPLMDDPAVGWIDLYFQIDPQGRWTSPQAVDPASPAASRLGSVVEHPGSIVQHRLEELRRNLPYEELRSRVVAAYGAGAAPMTAVTTASLRVPPGPFNGGFPVCTVDSPTGLRTRARRSRLPEQLSALARHSCEPPHLLQETARSPWPPAPPPENSSTPQVSVMPLGLEAIWYETPGSIEPSLLFVRQVVADGEEFFQGFTARWDRLKQELLAEARAIFPEAELVPVLDPAVPPDPASMITVPAELRVAAQNPVPAGAAWDAVRGTLLTTWGAAIVLLGAAGLGFRNLVALTDRRLQFAYAVTHELRTPLTTFQLYSDMLAEDLVPEGSRQEYLETLNAESKRLSGLVQGVLEYARLENQKVHLHPVETDSTALLQTIGERLSDRCARYGVRLVLQEANAAPLRHRTDVELIHQILAVLVNNGCRYAGHAPEPLVLIRVGGQAGRLEIDVMDSGPGVDRSDARRIFKPFRQGSRLNGSSQGGLGLGLALARGWSKILGGSLELVARNDPVHGGAHFRLSVPDCRSPAVL